MVLGECAPGVEVALVPRGVVSVVRSCVVVGPCEEEGGEEGETVLGEETCTSIVVSLGVAIVVRAGTTLDSFVVLLTASCSFVVVSGAVVVVVVLPGSAVTKGDGGSVAVSAGRVAASVTRSTGSL